MQLSGGWLSSGHTSSVLKYQSNNVHNGHISMPSMVHSRECFACSIFRSPAHNGRHVAIAAGGYGPGPNTAEVWDFTITGSSWQLSKHISATYLSLFLPFTISIKRVTIIMNEIFQK